MFLLPLGVIFGGYQLVWYGFSLLKGPGMGFLDLLLPTRVAKAQGIVDAWGREQRNIPAANRQVGVILEPRQPAPLTPLTGRS